MNDKRLENISFDDPHFSKLLESFPIGILLLDENDTIKFINQNFYEFGVCARDKDTNYIGAHAGSFKFFKDHNLIDEISSLKSGELLEKELLNFRSLSGNQISILVKAAPVFESEVYKGAVMIIEDISDTNDISSEKLFGSEIINDLLKNLYNYYIITDENGVVKYTSDNFADSDIIDSLDNNNDNIIKAANSRLSGELKAGYELLKKEKKLTSFKITLEDAGKSSSYKFTLIPFLNDSENIQTAAILIKDISNRVDKIKNYKIELDELKRYHQITSTIVDAVINLDEQGNITFWNESAEKLFGLSRSEVYKKFIGRVIPHIDNKYFDILKEELNSNRSWTGELWSEGKNKKAELMSVKMALFEGDENFIVMLCTSITERANLERELRQSEERYRNIVTNTREYICTFDLEGDINYVNPFFAEAFGYTEEEMLSRNIKDLINPDNEEENIISHDLIFNKDTTTFETVLIKKNKELVYTIANSNLILDMGGKPLYYNIVFTDISSQREVEKDLLMIRSMFEASQDGITVQVDRNYVLVNESFTKIFGYDNVDEIVGKDVLDFVAEEDLTKVANYVTAFERGEDTPKLYDFKGLKKDRSVINVEKSDSSYKTEEGIVVVSTFRDITEVKGAHDKLEISEARYRNISRNIDDCMWSAERKDGGFKNIFYSDAIKKITGYSSDTFISDQKLWIRIIHPDDSHRVVKSLQRIYKDAARVSGEIEYRIINDLGNIVWIKNKLNVLRDDKGTIQQIFGLVSDITLSKRGEEELKKSAKDLKALNEAKDRFISIISHDLRTPFSSILGFTDMLLSDRNMPEDKQVEYISFIKESSRNMLSLVNSLLDWTRLQTGRIEFAPRRINGKHLVTRSIQTLSGVSLQKNINLVSDSVEDVYIHADENLLLQVLNNLISNAIKFTGQGGTIVVSASQMGKKRQAQFIVKDTGTGIREADIPKLFKVDTKFTTLGTSGEKGSGLGLSLVYDIIKKHGGDIAVRSEVGSGTEMIFTMPVSSTKILLVDDIRTDRILYSKLLKNFVPDYTIDEAANGKEAFEQIKTTFPALVITDHKMPVMSGFDLVQQLNLSDLKYKPPVIILSSDLNDSIIDEYKEQGVVFAFKKPVNLTAFKFAVDKSLRQSITN